MAKPGPAIPTLRQRLARAAHLRRVSDAVPPTSYLTDLRNAARALPLTPTDTRDLLICLELDESGEDRLADPWARDDRFRLLLRRMDTRRTKKVLPRIAQFLDLVQQGYIHGLAHAMASDVRPYLLESLARCGETGDRSGLSEALRLVDPDDALKDPADIPEPWVRKAVLRVAREHIPRLGRGRIPELSPADQRKAKHAATARSKALRRLLGSYESLLRRGDDAAEAREQVLGAFNSRARLKDPHQRHLVTQEFKRRVRTEG
jgi:hypothetical protein